MVIAEVIENYNKLKTQISDLTQRYNLALEEIKECNKIDIDLTHMFENYGECPEAIQLISEEMVKHRTKRREIKNFMVEYEANKAALQTIETAITPNCYYKQLNMKYNLKSEATKELANKLEKLKDKPRVPIIVPQEFKEYKDVEKMGKPLKYEIVPYSDISEYIPFSDLTRPTLNITLRKGNWQLKTSSNKIVFSSTDLKKVVEYILTTNANVKYPDRFYNKMQKALAEYKVV